MDGNAQARELGEELRRARRNSGMTIEEILSVLGWAKVTLLRLEDGRRGKSAWDIARLLGVLHADTETCERVNRLLRQPVTREFVRSHPRRAHDDLAVLAVHEQRAATITTYDRTGVPPLLQTEDYARLDLAYTQDVDHALRIRLDRQKRMYEDWTPETPAVFYQRYSPKDTTPSTGRWWPSWTGSRSIRTGPSRSCTVAPTPSAAPRSTRRPPRPAKDTPPDDTPPDDTPPDDGPPDDASSAHRHRPAPPARRPVDRPPGQTARRW
ncbi:Scr1 family TA system antitoxin-like transcriptional regulator [Saccharothrix syringae]|uniref:Scr1 family TA system antitoxin-like transcriptional regulator n=1 Tax=Saccharothrix syringae TaxID=103733 RepID=UPI0024ACE531|nr:Scr1 family TA system antitoxin-like transcriptional regulator [Saccharothrix syringae]